MSILLSNCLIRMACFIEFSTKLSSDFVFFDFFGIRSAVSVLSGAANSDFLLSDYSTSVSEIFSALLSLSEGVSSSFF